MKVIVMLFALSLMPVAFAEEGAPKADAPAAATAEKDMKDAKKTGKKKMAMKKGKACKHGQEGCKMGEHKGHEGHEGHEGHKGHEGSDEHEGH